MDSKERAKRYSLWKKYGLTLEERIEMEKQQDGKCWICEQVPKGHLSVDHRHRKGEKNFTPEEKKQEVRALLCFCCNVMISKLERRKIARYLLGRINDYFKKFKIYGEE